MNYVAVCPIDDDYDDVVVFYLSLCFVSDFSLSLFLGTYTLNLYNIIESMNVNIKTYLTVQSPAKVQQNQTKPSK